MGGTHIDAESTPKAVPPTVNADVADRTPYIPRRKSSIGDRRTESCQDLTIIAPKQRRNGMTVGPKDRHFVKKSYVPDQGRRVPSVALTEVNAPTVMYKAVRPAISASSNTLLM
jgi:hypothetical protein